MLKPLAHYASDVINTGILFRHIPTLIISDTADNNNDTLLFLKSIFLENTVVHNNSKDIKNTYLKKKYYLTVFLHNGTHLLSRESVNIFIENTPGLHRIIFMTNAPRGEAPAFRKREVCFLYHSTTSFKEFTKALEKIAKDIKKSKNRIFSISLPIDLYEKAKDISEAENISFSHLVKSAIRDCIRKHELIKTKVEE